MNQTRPVLVTVCHGVLKSLPMQTLTHSFIRASAVALLGCLAAWAFFTGNDCRVFRAFADSREKASRTVDFVKEIQPILKASCYQCHGPEMQMGQLRLDSKILALQGGVSGKVIVS